MARLKIISPIASLESEYALMMENWKSTGEQLVPFTIRYDYDDFPALISQLENEAKGIGFKHKHVMVPHTSYWLVDEENTILGVSNLRHELNDALRQVGGHIGYGVTPLHRRKGNATKLLELTLIQARNMGIGDILVSCHADNIGSQKSIINNGGILDREYDLDGRPTQNYWIKSPDGPNV